MGVVMAFLLLVSAVPAQQPTVALTIRGIDPLLDDAEYVGQQMGRGGLKDAAESTLNIFTGGQGLAGIDRSKPLGLYWSAGPVMQMPVLYVPVSDAKKLKSLLTEQMSDFADEDGEWSMTLNGMKLHARISNGYMFLSPSPQMLTKPLDPAKLSRGKPDISLEVRIADVPRELRERFLEQAEASGRQSLEQGPEPKSEAERVGRDMGFEGALHLMRSLLLDGDLLNLGIDVDQSKGKFAMDLGLTGAPRSKMASAMAAYGQLKPAFAGLGTDAAPVRLLISYPTTSIVNQVDPVLKGVKETISRQIEADPNLKTDAERGGASDFADRLVDIVGATLKSGTMHSGVALESATNERIKIVAATRIARASEAEKLVDEIVKLKHTDKGLEKLKLDLAKAGGTRIHGIENTSIDPALGREPAHFCVSKDAVWVTVGGDNLDYLKQSLTKSATTTRTAAPISLMVKPAALIALMEKNNDALVERARRLEGKPGDRLLVEVAPIPNGAKLQIEFGLDLLKLADNQ